MGVLITLLIVSIIETFLLGFFMVRLREMRVRMQILDKELDNLVDECEQVMDLYKEEKDRLI